MTTSTAQADEGRTQAGAPDEGRAGRAAETADAGVRRQVDAGPLLAVCGLCGGAGASTLAYLVARAAARPDERAVLACDTGGPTAALAGYAGTRSPRSLATAADAIARGEALEEGLVAHAGPGLRVLARGPELGSEGDDRALGQLLADARQAHRLTVVDCGTLARAADRLALEAATHVAWVLPATLSAIRRGGRLLALFPASPARRELVVARAGDAQARAPIAALAELADERGGPLVLVPEVSDLAEHDAEQAVEAADPALDAIMAELRR